MENFQKNQEILINYHVKLTNRNPFVNLNPLSRNPGSAPGSVFWGTKCKHEFFSCGLSAAIQNYFFNSLPASVVCFITKCQGLQCLENSVHVDLDFKKPAYHQ